MQFLLYLFIIRRDPQPLVDTLTASAVPKAEEGAAAAAATSSAATQAGLFSSIGGALYLKDLIKPIPQHGKFVLLLKIGQII
jgi:hypothetical protein